MILAIEIFSKYCLDFLAEVHVTECERGMRDGSITPDLDAQPVANSISVLHTLDAIYTGAIYRCVVLIRIHGATSVGILFVVAITGGSRPLAGSS